MNANVQQFFQICLSLILRKWIAFIWNDAFKNASRRLRICTSLSAWEPLDFLSTCVNRSLECTKSPLLPDAMRHFRGRGPCSQSERARCPSQRISAHRSCEQCVDFTCTWAVAGMHGASMFTSCDLQMLQWSRCVAYVTTHTHQPRRLLSGTSLLPERAGRAAAATAAAATQGMTGACTGHVGLRWMMLMSVSWLQVYHCLIRELNECGYSIPKTSSFCFGMRGLKGGMITFQSHGMAWAAFRGRAAIMEIFH